MKKGLIILIIVIAIFTISFISYNYFTHNKKINNNETNYQATRTLAEKEYEQKNQDIIPKETELYKFSTNIIPNNKNRVTNIKITCSRINKTVVKAGKEFSFCDVVGQPSYADGYKPAHAFGANGEIIDAIGGGNCQVSTTIYNAALGVKGIKITERHEHARDVAYIKDGKDATVAYDYLDLKFKNTNNFDIKLYSEVKNNKVIVKINKVL